MREYPSEFEAFLQDLRRQVNQARIAEADLNCDFAVVMPRTSYLGALYGIDSEVDGKSVILVTPSVAAGFLWTAKQEAGF